MERERKGEAGRPGREGRGWKKEPRLVGWMKKGILAECLLLAVSAGVSFYQEQSRASRESSSASGGSASVSKGTAASKVLFVEDDYIKWVDFTVSYEALCQAYEWDVETHGTEHEIDWVELLAYAAAKTGGEFGKDALKTIDKAAEKLSEGEATMEELTEDLKYYDYYREAYDAVIGGLVGEYWEQTPDAGGSAGRTEGQTADSAGSGAAGQGQTGGAEREGYVERYGLKGYFPLARGFDYTHYDDFGVGRSYGYQRKHLGHDMMGLVGTPVMAIESGVVEALGWNQYGGWRIGIRSFDGKRYYYYAHLRQNYPYAEGLQKGSVVTAGDVIG